MSTTRLFLVRHGPTHAKGLVGWSDLPADLSDAPALRRLSAFLPEGAIVQSSDLIRAIATADAVTGPRQRQPHERALREMHFGDWELLHPREVEARDPERAAAFWNAPEEVRPPGGETWHELRRRVDTAIDRMRHLHPARDLVVVAHMGVILTQLLRARAVEEGEAFAQRIDPLSVSEVHIGPGGWHAERINHRP